MFNLLDLADAARLMHSTDISELMDEPPGSGIGSASGAPAPKTTSAPQETTAAARPRPLTGTENARAQAAVREHRLVAAE